jgi:uncharacterized protein
MAEKRIAVKVSAGAKTEKVEEVAPDTFKVRVHAAPEKGKANARVAELLAKHFNISMADIVLASGNTSRDKVFIIYT